jgi:hypothetical protein
VLGDELVVALDELVVLTLVRLDLLVHALEGLLDVVMRASRSRVDTRITVIPVFPPRMVLRLRPPCADRNPTGVGAAAAAN